MAIPRPEMPPPIMMTSFERDIFGRSSFGIGTEGKNNKEVGKLQYFETDFVNEIDCVYQRCGRGSL
jgi:hypothetical protein